MLSPGAFSFRYQSIIQVQRYYNWVHKSINVIHLCRFFFPKYHYSYLADVALSFSTFLPPTIHLRSFGIQRIPKFETSMPECLACFVFCFIFFYSIVMNIWIRSKYNWDGMHYNMHLVSSVDVLDDSNACNVSGPVATAKFPLSQILCFCLL